jgi:hypothetical protein
MLHGSISKIEHRSNDSLERRAAMILRIPKENENGTA